MIMMCRDPFIGSAGLAYGCGQCMPCRINKQRVWSHRIMLESLNHEHNSWVTLTYANVPEGGSLVPSDTRDWLKRFRKRVAPLRIRYFLVGEYGDDTERPHYHAALFGYPGCRYGRSQYGKMRRTCCDRCELVRETWNWGNIMLGTLEDASARYMAGYVTKKMTHKDDPRLHGRHPEFARMSLKPGIGYNAMWEVADVLMRYENGLNLKDVPNDLRHGMKKLPLGRYLRTKLRSMVGKDGKISQEAYDDLQKEMLALRLAAKWSEEKSLKALMVDGSAQAARNQATRFKVKRQRRTV